MHNYRYEKKLFTKRSFRKIEPERFTYEEWNDQIYCKNQIFTISSFIGMIQICVLIAMIYQDGFVSRAENPMIGYNLNSLSND
jgi:hypothetical protein